MKEKKKKEAEKKREEIIAGGESEIQKIKDQAAKKREKACNFLMERVVSSHSTD